MQTIFQYNNANGLVELALPEILLVDEFAALVKADRNKCKEDPKGDKKLRAFKEFTYIWLAIDWRSVYADFSEQERHQAAIADSGLTEEQYNDPLFRAACRKYKELRDSNRSVRALKSAQTIIDKSIDYFHNIDLEERDDQGKPVWKVKDVQAEVANLDKLLDALRALEMKVKKDIAEASAVRAGAVEGYTPKTK